MQPLRNVKAFHRARSPGASSRAASPGAASRAASPACAGPLPAAEPAGLPHAAAPRRHAGRQKIEITWLFTKVLHPKLAGAKSLDHSRFRTAGSSWPSCPNDARVRAAPTPGRGGRGHVRGRVSKYQQGGGCNMSEQTAEQ